MGVTSIEESHTADNQATMMCRTKNGESIKYIIYFTACSWALLKQSQPALLPVMGLITDLWDSAQAQCLVPVVVARPSLSLSDIKLWHFLKRLFCNHWVNLIQLIYCDFVKSSRLCKTLLRVYVGRLEPFGSYVFTEYLTCHWCLMIIMMYIYRMVSLNCLFFSRLHRTWTFYQYQWI